MPAGFDAPRLLRYDDVTAHAITRDDLGADVRGINASLDLIRETRRAIRRRLSEQNAIAGQCWTASVVAYAGARDPAAALLP